MPSPKIQDVRDSISILLEFYSDRPASRDSIIVGIRKDDLPTEQRRNQLVTFLQEQTYNRQLRAQLSHSELQVLDNAGKSSRERRKRT